jgi:hypothetical protein
MSQDALVKTLFVLGIAALAWQGYQWTWLPVPIAGSYELRRPGQFAEDKAPLHLVEQVDKRDFRYLPPAPQKPALLRFKTPYHGSAYVDGLRTAFFHASTQGGCSVLTLGDRVLTKLTCRV